MPKALRLSVLDQSPVPEGSTPAEALNHSVDLAQHAEEYGYSRFWMSEHHAMATLACTAPEIMLARVGAATSQIRLGSGGIMLPHYSPYKVAEVFRTLHALYPGRIDLGLGRAPGGGPLESLAIRRDRRSQPVDDFPEQLSEVLAFLGYESFPASHPFAKLTVAPEGPGAPRPWLLGSSMWSSAAAADFGLPYAFAHFFSPIATRHALEGYRANFRPSAVAQQPQATLAIGVICAETEAEAALLSSSVHLLQQRIRLGDRSPVVPPGRALDELESKPWPALEQGEWPRYLVGTPAAVGSRLRDLAAALQLDEVIVNTICWDHAARLRSYELLAREFHLTSDRGVAKAEQPQMQGAV